MSSVGLLEESISPARRVNIRLPVNRYCTGGAIGAAMNILAAYNWGSYNARPRMRNRIITQ